MDMEWKIKSFNQLENNDLYDFLKLRTDVFVVEQKCPYPELDGKDRHPGTLHLWGRDKNGQLMAYLRILPPGLSFNTAGIGRVVVSKHIRGQGIGDVLLKKAFYQIYKTWPGEDIRISAQEYLKAFYESHGFNAISRSFLEDGIPHIHMVRKFN